MDNHLLEIEAPKALESHSNAPSMPREVACGSICTFSQQENHLELELRSTSTRKLIGLIGFYLLAMSVEIVGGVKSNSLAVLTDAAHMFSDVAGFVISLFAVWASGWKATSHHTFGFYRIEVLGALLSIQLIWLIAGMLIYEAIDRIVHEKGKINGRVMFTVAAFGFIINLTVVTWLGDHHHHHHCHHQGRGGIAEEDPTAMLVSDHSHTKTTNKMNINLQGAYLHVITDLIQSIGVMITGAIIWAKPNWVVIDLICTSVFAVFVLLSTLPMLTNVLGILMERTPTEINVVGLENGLKSLKGVSKVHDLHVWSITAGKIAICCHVIVKPGVGSKDILHDIRQLCDKCYRINHVTVEIEQE